MTAHLTPEELYSLLSGSTSGSGSTLLAETSAHLEECRDCREEFTFLAQSLGNFKAAATHVSAQQASTRLLAPSTIHRGRFFSLPRAVWATGLAAAMAIGAISVRVFDQHPLRQPASQSASVTARVEGARTQSRSTQDQSDDALLQSIDKDLSATLPPSLEPLESSTSGATPGSSSD